MAIYLGTQGWSYTDWVGSFYPQGAKPTDFLSAYARSFDAVELDTTFYGIPAPSRVDIWRDGTPDGFQFTAKLPRSITHDRHLIDSEDELVAFVSVMERLGAKLGAILIQLPPDFKADQETILDGFLKALPSGFRFAAEFRHRSWLREQTFELLERHGVAWTMIDLRYMPITPRVTADFSYIRLLGDRRQVDRVHTTQIDRSRELGDWAEILEDVAQHVERVYGFVNNHYSGHSPSDVRRLRHLLGLPEPTDIPPPQQGSLL